MRTIIFATGNPHKLSEAAGILGKGFQLITPADCGLAGDIPETGNTLQANSLLKARFLWEQTGGKDCFADDTGLEVEILGGAPGVHTARYAGEGHDSDANMNKLLREMAAREHMASVMRSYGIATPHATRRARFRTSVTLILDGEIHQFEGVMEGRIALARSGAEGFGYDPVFIADAYPGQTVAELSPKVKNTISHRGKALRAMAEYLQSL